MTQKPLTLQPVAPGGADAERTSHALRMDRQYRYQRHVYDLTRKYYLFGRDRLMDGLKAQPGQSVLEIGCGTGRNLAYIADRYPDARLFGFDISREMLETAEKKFASRRCTRPMLKIGDAAAFRAGDLGETGFDRIVVSYALSMIPAWRDAIDRSLDALNPGGSLHVVDFGQQERLPPAFRGLLRTWLSRFHVTPRPDLVEVMREAAERRGGIVTSQAPYGGYAWLAVARLPG